MQRLYQELTKRRSAFDRTTDLDSASILSSSVDEKSRASRPTTKDKIFLDGIRFKGDVLRVGTSSCLRLHLRTKLTHSLPAYRRLDSHDEPGEPR